MLKDEYFVHVVEEGLLKNLLKYSFILLCWWRNRFSPSNTIVIIWGLCTHIRCKFCLVHLHLSRMVTFPLWPDVTFSCKNQWQNNVTFKYYLIKTALICCDELFNKGRIAYDDSNPNYKVVKNTRNFHVHFNIDLNKKSERECKIECMFMQLQKKSKKQKTK